MKKYQFINIMLTNGYYPLISHPSLKMKREKNNKVKKITDEFLNLKMNCQRYHVNFFLEVIILEMHTTALSLNLKHNTTDHSHWLRCSRKVNVNLGLPVDYGIVVLKELA